MASYTEKVLNWALNGSLCTPLHVDKDEASASGICMMSAEVDGGRVAYLDKYAMFSVPSDAAFVRTSDYASESVRDHYNRSKASFDIHKDLLLELTDTGMRKEIQSLKRKGTVRIFKTEDGTEVCLDEKYCKLLDKNCQLFAASRNPESSMVAVTRFGAFVGGIMPVMRNK